MYVKADWSAKAIGYALLQRENDTKGSWYAVQYGSKAMTKRKGSMGASIGELKATEVALKEFRPYLHAAKRFVVFSDHKALSYVTKNKEISAHTIRMLERASELGNFDIVHVPGTNKRIAVVDRLSRASFDDATTVKWSDVYSREQVSAVQTRSATKGQAEPASTRGAQLKEKQGQTDKVAGLGEINRTEEQDKDKDISCTSFIFCQFHLICDDYRHHL